MLGVILTHAYMKTLSECRGDSEENKKESLHLNSTPRAVAERTNRRTKSHLQWQCSWKKAMSARSPSRSYSGHGAPPGRTQFKGLGYRVGIESATRQAMYFEWLKD